MKSSRHKYQISFFPPESLLISSKRSTAWISSTWAWHDLCEIKAARGHARTPPPQRETWEQHTLICLHGALLSSWLLLAESLCCPSSRCCSWLLPSSQTKPHNRGSGGRDGRADQVCNKPPQEQKRPLYTCPRKRGLERIYQWTWLLI